ncbi:biotin--[acetyl-CoA-carboxylase] ligase [Bacteroidales bacterium OttesenSCG-928-M11]|nr:biotin--[acetyl-CoA-carboxylase] ligase [Bacteroidales bacterium OttesenSCG-928-M11]
MNLIRIESVESTNKYLKDLLNCHHLEEGTVVITDNQTAGRGQIGSSWEAEKGMNLTFSLLLCPTSLPIKEYFLLSKAISLGIKDALAPLLDVTIKWPNDIYYQDGKIAGVLIENSIIGKTILHSIVGIGLNVNQEFFISDAPNPISLVQIIGKKTSLEDLLNTVCDRIKERYESLFVDKTEVEQDYRRALYRREGFHSYRDRFGLFSARITNVTNDGFLHLVTEEGENRSYAFKEVSMFISHR